MTKPEPAAPQTVPQEAEAGYRPSTITWIPTRADTIVQDADGNIISINGEPAGKAKPLITPPAPANRPADDI